MDKTQKIIGTLVPISAIFSLKNSNKDRGTFASALIFLDWLKVTHQSAWQLLPLHQKQLEPGSSTKHVQSPYKSYGIGLDPIYLPTDFETITPTEGERNDFISKNHEWINDYALFCALRDYFHTDDWTNWGSNLRSRNKDTLEHWREKLKEKIDGHILIQWRLHKAYNQLKNKAKELNIYLIGDLPFYVSIKSPLVWAHQTIFDLSEDGSMQYVSGIPSIPSTFFGRQVWGHPLYRWKPRENWGNIIALWQMRLRYASTLFDSIRLDHAKAFFSYGVIDVESKQNDKHKEGPGKEVFEDIIRFAQKCGISVFIEEGSTNKIGEMEESMKTLKTPGINIFSFALDQKKDKVLNQYADVAHYPVCTVAYTTTHDTKTLLSYLQSLTILQKQKLALSTGLLYDPDDKKFAKILRDAIIASPARTVIIPMQDWLLTTDRINIPGTELSIDDPNWNYKLKIPIENLPQSF